MIRFYVSAAFFVLLVNLKVFSQVQMGIPGTHTENFDALLNTGSVNQWTDNSTISHVFSQRTTTSTLYTAGNGSSSTGGLYSFGTTGATERALGTIGSANTSFGGDFAHGILLQNVSGSTIPTLSVSYTLEQWRNGGNTTANIITFWYKISSSPIVSLNPGSNVGWTAVTAADASSPINTATASLLDGNLPANQVLISNVTIPALILPNGSYIMLKWSDPNHGGTDHGLAIDDLSISWSNTCANPLTYYQDADGDGFGNTDSTTQSCFPPVGYVSNNTDCNDLDSTINAIIKWYADNDNDGFGDLNSFLYNCGQPAGFVSDSSDCNDNNPSLSFATLWFQDLDNDGFGNVAITTINCGQPSGYVSDSTDCNDNDSNVSATSTWFQDTDNDGFGNADSMIVNCGQPAGYVSDSTDCNDLNSLINPLAVEVFDSLDNNCDGNIDEGFVLNTYYLDSDLDGFGGSVTVQATNPPGPNYVSITGDCNDNDNSINPSAIEICDGIDNDCDAFIDDSLSSFSSYLDADLDGFGNQDSLFVGCSVPSGYVLNADDCNDSDSTVFPGAIEIINNGIDEDCSGADSINTVSINTLDAIKNYQISPNPGRDYFQIRFNRPVENNLQIEILSIDGRIIRSEKIENGSKEIKLFTHSIENGIYWIRLFGENDSVCKKWIKN